MKDNWPTKKLDNNKSEDALFEKTYQKLSQDKNNIVIAYLSEIISLQSEYFYLKTRYLERKNKYLKGEYNGADEKKEIVDDYWIFVQNLIYRYYSLLEKLAQLINAIWLKKFQEENCSFNMIKKKCEKDKKFNFISSELDKLNIIQIDKILIERRNLVHRRIIKEEGSLFSSRILPLGGEDAKEFLKWKKESEQILETAYQTTFKVIENILKIFINNEK